MKRFAQIEQRPTKLNKKNTTTTTRKEAARTKISRNNERMLVKKSKNFRSCTKNEEKIQRSRWSTQQTNNDHRSKNRPRFSSTQRFVCILWKRCERLYYLFNASAPRPTYAARRSKFNTNYYLPMHVVKINERFS